MLLRPTRDYKEARKALSPSAQVALRYVEQGIAADPDDPGPTVIHGYRLPAFPDESISVVENGNLVVAYHRLDATTVSLDLVMDRRSPPDWFLVE